MTAPVAPTPKTTATNRARIRPGKATSMLISPVTVRPARRLSTDGSTPSVIPSPDANAVVSTAYQIDDRVATRTRANTSRPSPSVPARCSRLGPWSIDAVSICSAVSPQMSGAKRARNRSTTSPTNPMRPLAVVSSARVRCVTFTAHRSRMIERGSMMARRTSTIRLTVSVMAASNRLRVRAIG